MKIALCIIVGLAAFYGLIWSVWKVMQAIDEAFEAKSEATRNFYRAASQANTAARKAGKHPVTFIKEN